MATDPKLGRIIVDAKGRTLYDFVRPGAERARNSHARQLGALGSSAHSAGVGAAHTPPGDPAWVFSFLTQASKDQHRLHRVAAGAPKPEDESFWSADWERSGALIR